MKTIDVVQYGIKTTAIENDTFICAEWFANKVFTEFYKKYGRRYEGFDNRIFAIIGETVFNHITTWCPKSLVTVDEEPNENDITLVCDFNTAMQIVKNVKQF